MIPLFFDNNNKHPRWFDSAEDFIQNRLKESRSHYTTIPVILELCKLTPEYGFFIKWYEPGILHEVDGKRCYEPRDGWINSCSGIKSVTSKEEAIYNNSIARKVITEDINEGYTAFVVKLEAINLHK